MTSQSKHIRYRISERGGALLVQPKKIKFIYMYLSYTPQNLLRKITEINNVNTSTF